MLKLMRKFLRWPKPITVDLNQRAHRVKALLVLVAALTVAMGLLVGGVQAYTYTESTPFCGTVCHSMYPQAERHQMSAHANVDCAYCHVGPGAEAFVQSKIDGTRQLIGEITNNYNRPIPSPVHNLRPARETCEECHSPTTFKDNIIKILRSYDNDAENTPITTTLILKMGGWNPLTGVSKGIHWHINDKISYIALDEKRQNIAWVGVRQEDGSLKEYFAMDKLGMGQTAFVEEHAANGEVREMDCIDCHNRTAHYIPYPEQVVDDALANGLISRDLPNVRARAVEIMHQNYATLDEAYAAIDALAADYKNQPADVVSASMDALKEFYRSTHFSEMRLDWTSNPDNSRHSPSLGCFRCHDGKHFSIDENGNQEVISVECNLCHTVPLVGRGNELMVDAPVIVGNAPADHATFRWTVSHRGIGEFEKQNCYQCHGQAFCNNGVCHNLEHPEDMLFQHADIYRNSDDKTCYICHQNVTCTRCHVEGIFIKP